MTPQPAPSPTSGPVPAGPEQVAAAVNQLGALSGGTSTAGLYGLTSDASTYGFDTSNLNLPSSYGSTIDGKTLLNLFIASGSGRLGDGGAMASAIQHALYYSGAYGTTTSYIPQYGKVQKEDTAAFADQLNLLQKANSVSNGPDQPSLSVAQYLTQNAALGVGNGLGAGKVTDLRTVDNVRIPDTATLMAVADKAWQQVEGHKATVSQMRAFASAFQSAYTSAETANNTALYDAKVNLVTGKQQTKTAAATGTGNTPATANENPLTVRDAPIQLGTRQAQLGNGEPIQRDLGSVMGGLTDALNTDALNTDASHTNGILTGDTQVTTQALPTDASLAAQTFARNYDPKGAAAKDMANTFDNFLSILHTHFG